jgi:hypothetical protein
MSYRVWLTKTAETDFVTAKETKYREEKEITRFHGLEVNVDKVSGKSYISVYNVDPMDPTNEHHIFPKGSVRKVTFTHKHFDGFRNDGIYQHKGATARLETTQKIHSPHSMEDKSRFEIFQEIQISAGSLRTLRELYTKIRSGDLEPAEDWGSPMKTPSFEEVLGLMALVGARTQGSHTPTDMN